MYGILRNSTNSGSDSELIAKFAAPLSIQSNTPVFASDTISLKRKVTKQGSQRWELETNFVPSDRNSEFFANLVFKGAFDDYFIRMPQLYGRSQVSQTKVLRPFQFYNVGTTTLTITGLGTSNISIGEFIRFSNHSKVYMIKASGVNGVGAEIYPPLRLPVDVTDTIIFGDKVTMVAKLDATSLTGVTYSDGILSDPGSLKFVEAL